MIDIDSNDLNNAWIWMKCLVEKTPVNVADLDIALNFFGDRQETYLVINKYKSDTESIQYVLDTDDKSKRLSELLELIKSSDYRLTGLIEKLDKANYSDTEIGDVAILGKIKVVRSNEKSN